MTDPAAIARLTAFVDAKGPRSGHGDQLGCAFDPDARTSHDLTLSDLRAALGEIERQAAEIAEQAWRITERTNSVNVLMGRLDRAYAEIASLKRALAVGLAPATLTTLPTPPVSA